MKWIEDNTAAFRARLHDALGSAMAELGQAQAAALKESISIPYPPASRPGEPAHRRTGKLHDGVSFEMNQRGDYAELRLVSARSERPKVPFWLNYGTLNPDGTQRMAPRPHMTLAYMEARNTTLKAVAPAILAGIQGRKADSGK